MNNYLKYHLKSDFKLMGIVVGIIVAFSIFLGLTTDTVGMLTYGYILTFSNMLLGLWGFIYVIKIYFHFLNKEQNDVYGAMPIRKSDYFNTLLLRTLFIVGIPSLVITIATYLYFDTVKSFDLFAESMYLVGLETFFYDITSRLLDFGIFVFFIVICGKTSSFVVNIIFLNFIRFGIILPNSQYGESHYNIIIIQIIFAIMLIFLGKYLFNKRLGENIGNAYVYDKFDICSTIIYTTVLGILVAVSVISIYDWIGQLVITNIQTIVTYILLLICFKGFKKKTIKELKFIIIPILASNLVLIFAQWII